MFFINQQEKKEVINSAISIIEKCNNANTLYLVNKVLANYMKNTKTLPFQTPIKIGLLLSKNDICADFSVEELSSILQILVQQMISVGCDDC